MNVRGTVVEPGEQRTVSTRYGKRDVADISLRERDGEAIRVSLWGDWAVTSDILSSGMELVVTNVTVTDGAGDTNGAPDRYATTAESFVVVEPSILVDVTSVRSWVQCPRLYYLNKLSGVPLNYPVIKGTIIHEVFGDLLRGLELETAVEERVAEVGLELGLLDRSAEDVRSDVLAHAQAIRSWLEQGTLTEEDTWRSECTLISETFAMKGRADAIRRGMPVELKTGKNTNREPRFPDKIQAACYAIMLGDRGGIDGTDTDGPPDTGTLLYTRNATVDRAEEGGDLSPAKEFSIADGLLRFVVRTRNELAAMEFDFGVPTGYEGNAKCEYCFEQDTCLVVSGRLDQPSKAGQIGTAVPEHERSAFDRWYRAIESERRATHREYAKLWEQTAVERARDDRALIDLEPIGTRPIDGNRWELRASRNGSAVSKLREGDVALASDGDPIRGHAEIVRIQRLGETVVVTANEPVDVRRLDVYPSDIGANHRLTALHDAFLKGDERRKGILFGADRPAFDDGNVPFVTNNRAQNAAVNRAMNAKDFALVQGPPGTGKTHTIARIVRAAVDRGDRVLVSAFTNRAVDNALEAVLDQDDVDVIRVGTESGIREDMMRYRLTHRGDPGERAERLRSASVVAATTTTCGSRVLRTQSFDLAIVDEASQLTEPDTYAAINRADRFVLVGDHHQLPPVVRAETELGRSLFERLIEDHPEASVMLDRQYRMAQRIQAFASNEFYDGRLRPATHRVATQRIGGIAGVDEDLLPPGLRDPVAFVDVPGDDGEYTDRHEASRIVAIVDAFVDAGVDPHDIGVIAPFRAQVATIAESIQPAVTVDTVDRFQGSSKEVIVVSFVASGTLEGPIFEDHRRLNVALTRAKKSLVLVGTAEAIRTDPVYARMLEWANR